MTLGLLLLAVTGQTPCLAQDVSPADDGEATIAVRDTATDTAIRQRLLTIFSEVPELDEIDIQVKAGVVTLSGGIADDDVREQALALVKRTEGVVMTLDRFQTTGEVRDQISPALAKLREMGREIAVKSPLFGVALLIVGAFWWLGCVVYRRESWFDRLQVSSLAKALIRRLARLLLLAIGVVIALEVLDATAIVGAILGAAGLAGLAIGFAFKNIMENYLSGVLLSTRNPFEIGDAVEINGKAGKVALLTSRDTVLVTPDGNHLRIPNSMVINSELLNFSRNPRRRFEFEVGVSVDLDLAEARRIGLETLQKNPAVLEDPKPQILVDHLGDSTVNLKFFAWLDQREHDFLKTRSESIRMIKVAYDQAGIEMPEPIYRVRIKTVDSASGEASEPAEGQAAAPVKSPSVPVAAEDVSADSTMDEQIAEEQKLSKEKNLLLPEEVAAAAESPSLEAEANADRT